MELKKLQNGSDVRGIAIGEKTNLTTDAAYLIAKGYIKWLETKGIKSPKISIGTDSRITGPALKEACIKALTQSGAQVLDCAMASTPAMFMTTVTEGFLCDGAIMITASHLPSDRNGLKFFTKDGGLEKSDITELLDFAEKEDFVSGEGSVQQVDFMTTYSKILSDKIIDAVGEEKPLAGLKIIVDAGNGAGGFYAKKVLEPLGADITGSQFLNPDGSFPNHIPNPENKQAMESIVAAVKENNADFGVIFDTDVDRAGAVDKGGAELNKNRLIAAISAILISERPGACIVTDSITSSGLADFIAAKGGKHHRFKRGYKNVINEAIRLNKEGQYTPLAIETSGHAALKENYFLDDGAYLVTRLIITMAKLRKEGKTISDIIADLKEPAESVEFRLNINEEDFKAYGNGVIEAIEKYAQSKPEFIIAPDNHEGIRVSFDENNGNGWFLVRLSLHEPLLPINIESDEACGTKIIAQKLFEIIKDFSSLELKSIEDYVK